MLLPIFTFLTLSTLVHGHGVVLDPASRRPGDAMKAACGEQVYNAAKANLTGSIQGLAKIGETGKKFDAAACNLALCKGQKFEDNSKNVKKYKAGEIVAMKVKIEIKHTGTCNVSIVDTTNNKVISKELAYYPVYANSSLEKLPKNQTSFKITMPDVKKQCGTAGKCVIQWWWDSKEKMTTYESCVDFTMA